MGKELHSAACVILFGVVAVFFAACGASPRGAVVAPQHVAAEGGGGRPSPADRLIEAARKMTEESASDPRGYNMLAAAYMQKARETGDFELNAAAETALERSFELVPDNYDALKLRARLLLVYHRFEQALEIAGRAREADPRDHDVYGALTDAHVELGNYEEAVKAAQVMVDLRPYSPSYARVSYLRALHGDAEGAITAMRAAAESANPQDREATAWTRVQLGDELLNAGRLAEAGREYDAALHAFPGYHMARAAKARAAVAAGDFDAVARMYEQELALEPESADAMLALGDLYARAGRDGEARRLHDLFESRERENAARENDWHHLVYFWADHDRNLDEALTLARRERGRRKDVYTCDALAWALYKKGLFAEAKAAADEALRLGTRDAGLHYHAGMIARALGDRRAAAGHLKLALEINPSFDTLQAEAARRALATVSAG